MLIQNKNNSNDKIFSILFVQAKQEALSDIADSLRALREEVMNVLSNTDSSFTEQVFIRQEALGPILGSCYVLSGFHLGLKVWRGKIMGARKCGRNFCEAMPISGHHTPLLCACCVLP